MGVLQWPKVALKGESQTIPRLCPNCLKEAEVELRYCYIRPWDVLRPTRYFQSFRYCAGCGAAAAAHLRHLGRTGWLLKAPGAILALVGSCAGAAALTEAVLPGSRDPAVRGPVAAAGFAAGLAAVGLLAGLFAWWSKKAALRRSPPREGQAVWGVAAYYTGSTLLDLLGGSKVYRAARPEWLAALVRANPDQVDDATYRQLVGAEKPARQPQRPFAA